jgi:hypothetical protein
MEKGKSGVLSVGDRRCASMEGKREGARNVVDLVCAITERSEVDA